VQGSSLQLYVASRLRLAMFRYLSPLQHAAAYNFSVLLALPVSFQNAPKHGCCAYNCAHVIMLLP